MVALLSYPVCTRRSFCAMAITSRSVPPAATEIPNEGPLFLRYPVNSVLELTLSPNSEVVRGLVYCTDDISNSVVLKKSLAHTTLASEVRIINADSVTSKKVIHAVAPTKAQDGEAAEELFLPLPNVNKKSLEEREKRAIRLAEESFLHINQKVRTMSNIALFHFIVHQTNNTCAGVSGGTGSL